MRERYDDDAARHYAAFRPPLHELLLTRLVQQGETFSTGLDVGSGTGRSAAALARHCERVVALEPSGEMLREARPHPQVTYLQGTMDTLDGSHRSAYDVVTFAGSLFYAKGERLRPALAAACAAQAAILVYDFDILLTDTIALLGAHAPATASDYDHATDLSDWRELEPVAIVREREPIEMTAEQTAHVLLADSNSHDALRTLLPAGELFVSLVDRLQAMSPRPPVQADLFHSRFRLRDA